MGQNGPNLSRRFSITLLMGVLCIGVCACTMPRIIVLNDPLSAEEHNDLGVAYEQKGLYDLAEKEYQKACQKRDGWAVPYFNLGNLHFKRGDDRKAEDAFRKALAMDGNNPDTLNNLAYLLYMRGNYGEARVLVEKALGIARKKEYLDTYQKILEKTP